MRIVEEFRSRAEEFRRRIQSGERFHRDRPQRPDADDSSERTP
jgi:hypothetical protein